jgi:hypothetical protein
MPAPKDGGAAFPAPDYMVQDHCCESTILKLRNSQGMTLRDYFAAAAMQGILACPDLGVEWHADITAANAYKQADAMLAAREKGGQ